jgi:hypothetical protein
VKLKFLSVCILCGLALAGCNKGKEDGTPAPTSATSPANTYCSNKDDRDLEKTAKCFHMGSPPDPWSLLSREAQAESGSREEFNRNSGPDIEKPVAYRVLGIETKGGQTLARIEAVWNRMSEAGKPCKSRETYSWILEASAWRRLYLPKTQETNKQQFANGDYSASLSTAEKWLSIDPFSIEAYGKLAYSLSRGGKSSLNTRSIPDVLRAALSVNAADSRALRLAVSFTTDPDVAAGLLEKFEADDCERETAAFNLALDLPPKRAIALLEKLGSDWSMIHMQIIIIASNSGDRKTVERTLTNERDGQIRTALDKRDSGVAALWSVAMGRAWLTLNNKDAAKRWALYAATRDPNEPELPKLLRLVRN